MHVCIGDYTAMDDAHSRIIAVPPSASLQDTCYQFWPSAEGGTLNVGHDQMNVTLLKKKKTSDFDSYKMTIQKTNLVSLDKLSWIFYYILFYYYLVIDSQTRCV